MLLPGDVAGGTMGPFGVALLLETSAHMYDKCFDGMQTFFFLLHP